MSDSILTRVRYLNPALAARAWAVAFWAYFEAFAESEKGVTAIEYALIAALIAVGILTGVASLGTEVEGMYLRVCNAVVGALGGGSC